MLNCQQVNAHLSGRPWLVLLHGLLGSGEDWQSLLPHLGEFRCLLVDLPGHGRSASMTAAGFADVSQQLTATLQQLGIDDYWLLGYSLGGRISLYHACYGDTRGLHGVLVEGANPGLKTLRDRQQRRHHDQLWITRFRFQPIEQVLQLWYRQPVFSDLSDAQRQRLVDLRARNHAPAIATMLGGHLSGGAARPAPALVAPRAAGGLAVRRTGPEIYASRAAGRFPAAHHRQCRA
ncbi:2-succinyl-6-hydroxy-2,4-cyclohexadiene-1-carboxylate synthase [Ewingella americana]|uniref:2-succinyl-6-hydroxy-2,4-cyclohexadiene-1-carboxy late synthase n=1 Tax=Ewingella americana TaxID=41202 RepID=A0A377NA19_9GAMM|nr:2-succinyl-6-hydroxy-2,4-cyclohexadiene-1-carboxylate synthase [Ewingella americana]